MQLSGRSPHPLAVTLVLLAVMAVIPVSLVWAGPAATPPEPAVLPVAPTVQSASAGAVAKLDAGLRSRLATVSAGDEAVVSVVIKSSAPLRLGHLADRAVSTPWPLGQWVTLARVPVRNLAKVAGIDSVSLIEDGLHPVLATDEVPVAGRPRVLDLDQARSRLAELRRREVPYDSAPPLTLASAVTSGGRGAAAPAAWYDVVAGHGSSRAWARGWRGEGVVVGVSDTGVDFGTPELVGTWAVVNDAQSPYNGWPLALDAQGLYTYVQDFQLGTRNAEVGAAGHISLTQTSRATRTWDGRTNPWGKACFKRVLTGNLLDDDRVCDYTVPWLSRSGVYRFGVHPDGTLLTLYGERPGVLLVDQATSGVYDTVYVDLDNDHDFTDEKAVTKADPLAYRDMDGDGVIDLSGGLLYWISDGTNPPPGAYLWGDLAPTPARGALVTFIGPWGGTHGTMCASNVVGQGRLPVPAGVNLRFRDLPGTGAPATLLVGAAPGAKMVGIYRGGVVVTESTYVWAAKGNDPARTGDEIQVLSNSYGFNDVVNEGWDDTSRLLDYLTTVSPNTTYVFSSGNGGPGYGSIRGPNGRNVIKVAASTEIGSTGYDSITETNQITWGDIIGFSSSGPGSDGTIGPHVAADGAYASGAVPVNSTLNGLDTIGTWGGTSRSTPVTVGNVALTYQAFKSRAGRWPTWSEARAILMAGAQHMGYDAFTYGAGIIDGGQAALIAGGVDGVYAEPGLLYPGDYRGAAYPNFPNLLHRGDEARSWAITITNPSPGPVRLDLAGQTSRRIGSYEFDWESKPLATESASFSEVPDYVIPVPQDQVPAGTELMAVRFVHPQAENDLGLNYATDNRWYLRVYQHTDVNGDGAWWHDRDGDGVVDKQILTTSHQLDGLADVNWATTEVDRWEYARFGQDTRQNNNKVVWVHHPLERWRDGLYIGLQHGGRATAMPVTRLHFRVDFYRYEDWPWLQVTPASVTVPAGGAATAMVRVEVPADAPYGYFQGAVFGRYLDERPGASPYHRLTVPVMLNVAADLAVGAGPSWPFVAYLPVADKEHQEYGSGPIAASAAAAVAGDAVTAATARLAGWTASLRAEDMAPEFGGAAAQDADLPYANGLVRGMNFWGYGPESGDWRYFFVDVPRADKPGTRLVVRSAWQDDKATLADGQVVPVSDINTIVFGPTTDRWTDPNHPDNATENLANPAMFGPTTTEWVGASVGAQPTTTVWRFQTATGDYEEWVSAELRPGLNVVTAHNELISGAKVDVPFGMRVDRLQVLPTRIADVGSGCADVSLTATIDFDDLTAEGFGLSPEEALIGQTVIQDDPNTVTTASWRRTFTVSHGSRIEVRMDGREGNDLDLFLYYDANGDGTAEQQVASSTTDQPDEAISYMGPADGRYMVTVHGWNVPAGTTTFDLVLQAVQGTNLRVSGFPSGAVPAGTPVTLAVCYDLPRGTVGRNLGDLFIGPSRVPRLISVPLEIWGD